MRPVSNRLIMHLTNKGYLATAFVVDLYPAPEIQKISNKLSDNIFVLNKLVRLSEFQIRK